MMDIKYKEFNNCCSNYVMGWKIYKEGRTDRPSGTKSKADRLSTDTKTSRNTKINHIMVSFTDDFNTVYIDKLPSKTRLEKIHDTLIILSYGSQSSPQLQRIFILINDT